MTQGTARVGRARARALLLAVLGAVALLVLGAAPAAAHGEDPRRVGVLEGVDPALPPEVVLQLRTGVADQLVAANPTDVPLVVVARGGEPFLRLSASGGAEVNLDSPDAYTTLDPFGAAPVPEGVRSDPAAEPRWSRVAVGPEWGWFDHRLHPESAAEPLPPDEPGEEPAPVEVLDRWEVPLRYGDAAATVRGRVELRRLLGSFGVSLTSSPPGVSAQVLQGRLPGLFLVAPDDGSTVTVLGDDGLPYAELRPDGVWVDVASPTHLRDSGQASVVPADLPDPAAQRPVLEKVSDGRSHTWVDPRLSYGADRPPDDVLAAGVPTEVGRWEVPLLVDGRPAALSGAIGWVPVAEGETPDASAAGTGTGDEGGLSSSPALVPASLAVVAVLGALALARLARQRRAA